MNFQWFLVVEVAISNSWIHRSGKHEGAIFHTSPDKLATVDLPYIIAGDNSLRRDGDVGHVAWAHEKAHIFDQRKLGAVLHECEKPLNNRDIV